MDAFGGRRRVAWSLQLGRGVSRMAFGLCASLSTTARSLVPAALAAYSPFVPRRWGIVCSMGAATVKDSDDAAWPRPLKFCPV